ncbi:glycosyltransferase [Nesterenkonia sp. CF4.4]|uniref:glycosyltransferase n=1 Tax=Nesterenkonia sp. CF4.4 TaxID=3373079 RepID=UPI003EE59F8B
MNPRRQRQPFDRHSQLAVGRARIERLLASRNPLKELRDPALLASLGVSESSPFRGGVAHPDNQPEFMGPIGDLPRLESGVAKPAMPVTVGVFGDDSLVEAFENSAAMTAIDPLDWETGVRNSHVVMIGPRSTQSRQSRGKIIDYAREHALPLLYVDLGTAAPTAEQLRLAARCDQVFTVSEENAVLFQDPGAGHPASSDAAARAWLPDRNPVAIIASPINPLRRSPLGSRRARPGLVTYLGDQDSRLPTEALPSLEWILDGVLAAGADLLIGPEARAEAALSTKYWPHVQDWVSNHRCELDRLTDIAVVAHTISSSQTAFSPRVIELQASGSLVLSTYNQGVNSFYPQAHVANSTLDVASMLESLQNTDLRRAQNDGVRQVFTENHATDVLRQILRTVGVSDPEPSPRVLAVTGDADDTLRAELAAQTAGGVDVVTWDQARAHPDRYDLLLPVTSAHHYASTYVADHLAALTYQSASVVQKLEPGTADQGHHHAEGSQGDLGLTAWWQPDAGAELSLEHLTQRLAEARVYVSEESSHRPRRQGSGRRTVQELARGDQFDEVRREVAQTVREEDLRLSVVVPIYNNGPHLLHKAFASLLRSSAFADMHVLLVSDGSTDPRTLDTIQDLAEDHANVTAFHHAKGGSGSASRPRNTGLDLAQTEFVTYLDPDNEAIDDGYAVLYEAIREHQGVDFVLGNMSQWAKRRSMQPYAEVLQTAFADDIDGAGNISVPPRALEALRFRPMGIQTVVARTEWLQSLNLTQPVGAVGQDSYFFQQMLHYARSIRAIDIGVHTYYMVVSNSTVNTLNPNYFKKYLPLDKARAQWLDEVGLLDAYKADRLEPFLVSWLLPKLKRVKRDEWQEAAENLAELLGYYGEYKWTQPTAISFWEDLNAARAHRG